MPGISDRKRQAIIIGGSLGGLLTANLLYRAGWSVDVYERVSGELSGRGAGLVTHPELFAALERAGVTVDETIGIDVETRITFGHRGEVVGERSLPQTFTGWSRLYQLLKSAFPAEHYHTGRTLVAVAQDEAGVTARFAEGNEARGDFLVSADGIRSSVRGLFMPEVQPVYAGYVAWRGLVEESAISPATHAAIFERFGFCLPEQEQMLGYPVAGAGDSIRPGHRRYNFVWYRPADEERELRRLLTDDDGRYHKDGIPPGLVSAAVIREVREAADRLLAPQFAEIVRLTRQPFFQPIYDLESPRLAFGRVVLAGDAAFVARPHCGMGVTKAAGDAVALADALGDPSAALEDALRIYEAERLRFGRTVVAHARHLGAYMQAQLRTAEERAMAEKYRTPAAVMRETAVPLALQP